MGNLTFFYKEVVIETYMSFLDCLSYSGENFDEAKMVILI